MHDDERDRPFSRRSAGSLPSDQCDYLTVERALVGAGFGRRADRLAELLVELHGRGRAITVLSAELRTLDAWQPVDEQLRSLGLRTVSVLSHAAERFVEQLARVCMGLS